MFTRCLAAGPSHAFPVLCCNVSVAWVRVTMLKKNTENPAVQTCVLFGHGSVIIRPPGARRESGGVRICTTRAKAFTFWEIRNSRLLEVVFSKHVAVRRPHGAWRSPSNKHVLGAAIWGNNGYRFGKRLRNGPAPKCQLGRLHVDWPAMRSIGGAKWRHEVQSDGRSAGNRKLLGSAGKQSGYLINPRCAVSRSSGPSWALCGASRRGGK